MKVTQIDLKSNMDRFIAKSNSTVTNKETFKIQYG